MAVCQYECECLLKKKLICLGNYLILGTFHNNKMQTVLRFFVCLNCCIIGFKTCYICMLNKNNDHEYCIFKDNIYPTYL